MKKILLIILVILAFCGTLFAQENEIPDWMENSVILMTKEFTGKTETISSLFGTPSESTKVNVYVKDNELQLCHEISLYDIVILKLDVTFKLSKVLDGGTCFPSKLYYESPLTFESETLTCKDPYNDSRAYGYLLGTLYEFLPMFYEQEDQWK